MRYLQREQRRDLILAAAMRLALDGGLSGLTARGVAQAAEVSTGQVHHHFQSTSHLKAAAFLQLMQQLSQLEAQVNTQSFYQKLILELGAEDIQQSQPYLRLWNEAEILMQQDPVLKQAYIENMQIWYQAVLQLIEAGIAAQEFQLPADRQPSDVAWRLMAFVCGLEGMYQLALVEWSAADFKRHTQIMINAELMALS